MSAEKGLTLPEGTKVRMTSDHGTFNKGDIVTRMYGQQDDSDGVYFETDDYGRYLQDYTWELIEDKEEIKEDPKEEIKEEPRLPKQGDIIDVRDNWNHKWVHKYGAFIAFYNGKVIVENRDGYPVTFDEWRFSEQEEVTLSDGLTYFVKERDGTKYLVEKQ